MTGKKVNFSSGDISGAVTIGDQNQTIIRDGEIKIGNQNQMSLAELIQIIKIYSSESNNSSPEIQKYIKILEHESSKTPNNTNLIRKILEELKTITEGIIGSLIATYLTG